MKSQVGFFPERRRIVLAATDDYIKRHGYSPTMRELCKITGISSTSVVRLHIMHLKEAGYLTVPTGPKGEYLARVMRLTERGEEAVREHETGSYPTRQKSAERASVSLLAQWLPEQFADMTNDEIEQAISQMTLSERALLAGEVVMQSGQAKKKRAKWIKQARNSCADNRARQSCAVCGMYESVTEAHHILPLEIQSQLNALEPNHEIAWLCPTHHSGLHLILKARMAHRGIVLDGFPVEEVSGLERIADRFASLYKAMSAK